MFPSSLTDQLLSIVDSYHFSDDSLKIEALTKLEQAFMDHLLTNILVAIPESQRDSVIALYHSQTSEEFVNACTDLIPERDDFLDDNIETFKAWLEV